ncbi:uncharacterized protein [Amphiura filiformis]|uniref:uncharacterized protein n=1 Tax=Amphiura filiformis TaxID=82378 RepID=UPI003B214656
MKAKYRMQGSQNRVHAPHSRITKNTVLLQPFKCRYCLRWWSNFEGYRRHMRSHQKWRSRISEVQEGDRPCQSQNTEQLALDLGLPVTGNGFQQTKKTHECDNCKKHFLTLSTFDDHKCITDSGSTHQATHVQPKCQCAKGFATHDPLKEHSYSNSFIHNSHSTCDHCKMQNSSLERHKSHVKMQHSVDFATKDNRQQTTKNVAQISIAYECDKCTNRFLTLLAFDEHECISDSQSGSTHQATHVQPKGNHEQVGRPHSLLPWFCNKCGMGFATKDSLNEHKTMHVDEGNNTSQPHGDETEYRNKVASSLVAIECDKCRLQFPILARFNSHKCISNIRNGVAILRANSIPRKGKAHLEKHVKMQHLVDSATKDNQQQMTKNVSENSSLNECDHSDTRSGSTHQAPHFQPKSIHDTTSDVIKHKKRHSSVASGVAVGADLKRGRRSGKIGTRRRRERRGREGEREGKGKESGKRSERGGREGKKKREREERESKYRDDTFATNNVCHPGLTMLAMRLNRQHSLHRWMCCKCTLGFATHDNLKAHELIVHNSHCTCDHCKMQLGRNLSLIRPSKMVHSVNITTKDKQQKTTKKSPQISIAYECDKCKKRFLILTEFDQHKCISDTQSGSTHQGPGIQSKCNHCNMRLAATSDVAKQEKRQRSVLQWMCRKCGMGFATNDDLNEHKTIHEASDTSQPHEDETEYRNKVASSLVAIECDKCRQQFPNLARFSSHKCISDTRNGVAILRATSIPRKRNSHPQCEHCNRHFGTKPNLERSVGTKDNREKNNKVSSTSNRNNGGPNVSSHNETRVTLNECLLCNKVFSSEEDFAQHNKSHHLKDRTGEATCLSTTNKNDELETNGDLDKSVHNEPTLFESMLRTKYFSIHKDLVKLCETQLNKDTERVCPCCDRKFEGK